MKHENNKHEKENFDNKSLYSHYFVKFLLSATVPFVCKAKLFQEGKIIFIYYPFSGENIKSSMLLKSALSQPI